MDSMVAEDMWLRNLLDLPEREMWNFEIEVSSSSESGKTNKTFTERVDVYAAHCCVITSQRSLKRKMRRMR